MVAPGRVTVFLLPVPGGSEEDNYSFFNSVAGFVRAAFRVCQRTEMRLKTRVMTTASTNI